MVAMMTRWELRTQWSLRFLGRDRKTRLEEYLLFLFAPPQPGDKNRLPPIRPIPSLWFGFPIRLQMLIETTGGGD